MSPERGQKLRQGLDQARGSVGHIVGLVAWVHLYVLSMLGGWIVIVMLATGWQPIVLTSGSMSPALRPGDILLIDEHPDDLVGQRSVITFAADPGSEPAQLITHRVFEVLDDGTYVTKGDANPTPDTDRVHPDDVHGVGHLVVPLIGLPVIWAQQGQTIPLVAFTVLSAAALVVATSSGVSFRRRVTNERSTTKLADRGVRLVRALAGLMIVSQFFIGGSEFRGGLGGVSYTLVLTVGLGGLVVVSWLSSIVARTDNRALASRIVRAELIGDTLVVILLTAVTGGSGIGWVLMALPIVEAAVRFRLAGALLHWLAMASATFLSRLWIMERGDQPMTELMQGLEQMLDQFAVLLLVAIPGAYLAEQLMVDVAAQQQATDSAVERGRRLEHVAEISHEVNRLGAALYETLTEACLKLGYDVADICVRRGGDWFVAATASTQSWGGLPAPGQAGSGLRDGDLATPEVVVDGDDPDPTETRDLTAAGLGCLVRVVLARTESTYICIRAAGRTPRPDPGSVEALRLLCGQATVALQNQKLVSELQSVHDEMEHQATHDPLTGLPNRVLFMRQLSTQLAEATDPSRRHQVLFLDLNGFKQVNDTHGHEAGDALLCLVAQRLSDAIGRAGLVARLGGDEFTVLLNPLGSVEEGLTFASRIHAVLTEPFDLGSTNAVVGTSVGISMAELGVDETELLRRADAAMYAAKTRGGTTRTAVYDPSMDESDRRRGRLSAEFEQAFDRGELSLAFQPIVSAYDHSVAGAEALLRWRHRELGPVSTATILELAELRGLMMKLNAWIVATALDMLATVDGDDQSSFFVAVNLSPTELESPELVSNVSDALLTHQVAPNRLILELSERLIIDQTDQRDNIAALAALGVTLSLDDFGEGRTALTHLRGIPIAQLKLDRSLIQRAETSDTDRTILDSIVSLAHDLSLEVVAEGVEHQGQIDMARDAGADLLQGYGLFRPMPLNQLSQLVATRPSRRPGDRPPPPRPRQARGRTG